MLVLKNEIEKYIPQRKPVVMVDALLDADEKSARSVFQIEHDNLFVEDGFFREPGLIENIAQTAALHAGFRSRQLGVPVPVAFIAAIRQLEVFVLPEIGAELITKVTIINSVFDVTIIHGEVTNNGSLLCKCEMRIYVKPE
ncbi:MAG TPA: 3-hydroxyacyl-ACP dehydratase [Chryseosolibacter sp.]|nr:3-hydroxyacyl-ACP dehydratase [Chryseosolibacter sp.]